MNRQQPLLSVLTIVLLVALQAQLLPAFSTTSNDPAVIANKADKSTVQAQYASLPLAFEPNQGQADGGAQFLVHHGQATTYFDGANTTTSIGNDNVTMSLDGANTPNFAGTDQLESKTNYFIGNDQSKWHSDVPNYQQLLAKNVYPDIDLKYYGTNSQLEHDFIVNPGADPRHIALHFVGQNELSLDKDGNLILKAGESDLRLNAPTTYQATLNSKHTIPSHFELKDNTVTVALNEDYDHSQALIIDPVLVYSTYLGGNVSDQGKAITVDANGNAYVTGTTLSTNFPTSSPFQGSSGGGGDAFVTKFNPSGSALIYSTYLGGGGADQGNSIAVDFNGNAYVTGQTTSTNFPTSSPFQSSNIGGFDDAFVTKLNAVGSALAYSTYLGGSNQDEGYGIAVDTSGDAYVTGRAASTNFPTNAPFQASNGGADDAFVTKFNPAGSALMYSTYVGGSFNDEGLAIAVDMNGSSFITGITNSTNFPTNSPFQGSLSGAGDAFVTKLNPTGSALSYSTYLGGSNASSGDSGLGIAVDLLDDAYVTGQTPSTNFPTSSPVQASNAGGSQDAFVTKLNPAGFALIYSTYLGGSGDDRGLGITVDTSGRAYVTGRTTSANFPISSPFQAGYGSGTSDAFVTKVNASGSALSYSTYLGGSGTDEGDGIAVGLNGNAYITGQTTSTNFPTATPFQSSISGGGNAFITQLTENTVTLTGHVDPTMTFSIGSTTCNMGLFSSAQTQFCTHTISASSNATSGYIISYIPTTTLTSGANTITAMAAQGASVLNTEQFGMNLRANTSAGSFTASNFGADPSGGTGTAMTGYQTANQFKFATGGANIAQTAGASTTTTYTASFITNINIGSEAGIYSTPVTYNIVGSY